MKKKFSDLTKKELWKLRQEITLNSLFLGDYKNSFGFNREDMCSFFDGYYSFLWELAIEYYGKKGIKKDDLDYYLVMSEYDNADVLEEWFYCSNDYSWIRYENEL